MNPRPGDLIRIHDGHNVPHPHEMYGIFLYHSANDTYVAFVEARIIRLSSDPAVSGCQIMARGTRCESAS